MADTWRITDVGSYFWDSHQKIFRCPECELELAEGLLKEYHQAHHGRDISPQW